MSVYKIAIGNSFRFVRAINNFEARFIASRIWNNGKPVHAVSMGQQSPEIGGAVYNRIVHGDGEKDTALFIARRSTGKLTQKVNSFYKTSEVGKDKKIAIGLKALAIIGF